MKPDAMSTKSQQEERPPTNMAYTAGTNATTSGHEDPPDLSHKLENHGLVLSPDGYVRWNNKNPDHPRNWSTGRKTYDTAVIIFLEFITYVAAFKPYEKTSTRG